MILLVLFVTIGTMMSSVSAATINIADGASLEDIQAAINGASFGDVISFAANGVYNIAGSINIDKGLTILGNGAEITGVSGSNTYIFNLRQNASSPEIFRDITISGFNLIAQSAINIAGGNNITLDNLTLEGTTLAAGYGINSRTANELTINDVEISGFRDALGVGGGIGTTINNSFFHDLGRNGMSFFQSATNITVNNSVLDNAQYGVFFGGGVENITITNSEITQMQRIGLALIKSAGTAYITNNNISDNGIGIVIKAGDTAHGEPTIVSDILLDGNKVTLNYLIGLLIENVPERSIQKDIVITDSNNITGNGKGFKDSLNWSDGEWETEINGSFDIIKKYHTEDAPAGEPKLTMDSSVSTNVVKNGAKLIYTITVKNIGEGASGVINIDNGILSSIANTIVTYKSTGSFANNKWTINSLGAGDTASLVLEATTKKSGTQNIVSTLKTSTQGDVKSNAKKLTVNKDIQVTGQYKMNTKQRVNKYVIYTAQFKNNGLDDSAKITSKVATTKGLKLAAVSKSSYASYNSKTKSWTVSKVPSKKSVTVKMKFKTTKTGTQAVKLGNDAKSLKKVKVIK